MVYAERQLHPLRTRYAGSAGSLAEGNGVRQSAAGQSVAAVALLEKHAKTRLAVAADHFNRDYKKGFQFLQVQQATTCTATTGRSN